jgi:hypothetical protein
LYGVDVEPATSNPWSDLKMLEELILDNTFGVPYPAAALADMGCLTYLSITTTDAKKEPLPLGRELAAASALRKLSLIAPNDAAVSDDSLDQLTKLPALHCLRLDSYRVNVDGVPLAPIHGLTQLSKLAINNPSPPIHPLPRCDRRVCAALGFPGLRSITGKIE